MNARKVVIGAALAGIALTAFTLGRREAGLRFAGHQPFGFSAISRRESMARPWFDGQVPLIGRLRFPNPDPDLQRVREIIEFNYDAAGIVQIARSDPARVPMLEVADQFVPLQSDERAHRDLMVIIPKAYGMRPIKAKLHYGGEIADLELPPMREPPPRSGERSVAIGRYTVRFKVPRQAVPHILNYVEVSVDGRQPGEVVVLTSDHDKTWSLLVGDYPGMWTMYPNEKMPLSFHLSTVTQSDLTLTAVVSRWKPRYAKLRTAEGVTFLEANIDAGTMRGPYEVGHTIIHVPGIRFSVDDPSQPAPPIPLSSTALWGELDRLADGQKIKAKGFTRGRAVGGASVTLPIGK